MEYRRLGSSGLKVSALSLGTWVTFGEQVGEERAEECLKAAFEAGVNLFDTAESYGRGKAERVLGRLLRKFGWERSDLVISTKVFWGGPGPNDTGLSRKHIHEACLASLERLQLDYLDLFFCHRPDKDVPVEETVRAMSDLVRRGLVLYWGTSEWPAELVREAYLLARGEGLVPPTAEQPQYNLFFRERVEKEYSRLFVELGLGATTWSPLADGFLTGKYLRGIPAGTRFSLQDYGWLKDRFLGQDAVEKADKVRAFLGLAEELELSPARLAIAWCLKNPNVSSVLTGATRAAQVKENMSALEVVARLTPGVLDRLDGIFKNRPSPEPDLRTRS